MQSWNSINKVPMKKKYLAFFASFVLSLLLVWVIRSFFIGAYKIPSVSMENTLRKGDFLLADKISYGIRVPFTNWRLPGIKKPERDDVILFDFPGNINEISPSKEAVFVKRCMALPGETLEIRDGSVYINGRIFRSRGSIKDSGLKQEHDFGPVLLPAKSMKIALRPDNIRFYGILIERELGRRAVSVDGNSVCIDGKPCGSYVFKDDYYFVLGDNRSNSYDSRFWGFLPGNKILGRALVLYFSGNFEGRTSDYFNLLTTIRWNRIAKLIQ